MSQLLDEIKKIQDATKCSLAEAKDAYDKASGDIDLAIALVEERNSMQETKNNENIAYKTANEKPEPKKEKPNPMMDLFTKEETKEDIIQRTKKSVKILLFFFFLTLIFGGGIVMIYLLVEKSMFVLSLGIIFASFSFIYLFGVKMIKNNNKKIIYLMDKYPSVSSYQIKMVVLNHSKRDKDLESIERDVRALAGEEGEDRKEEIENKNQESAQKITKLANNGKKSKVLVPIILIAMIIVALFVMPLVTSSIYGGYSPFYGLTTLAQPNKAYKAVKKEIDDGALALGVNEVKYNGGEYVFFYLKTPQKSSSVSYDELMDDTSCDIVIKVTYSLTVLGIPVSETGYYGYNTKTKTVKYFENFTAADFTEAKQQVNNDNYKGRTGKVG